MSPSARKALCANGGRLIAAPTRDQGSRCRGGYHPPGIPCPLAPPWGSWHGAAVTERAARKKIKKTLDGQGLGVV